MKMAREAGAISPGLGLRWMAHSDNSRGAKNREWAEIHS